MIGGSKIAYMLISMFSLSSIIDQEERERSVKAFRAAKKDVLVATDVASKGLDFPNIQHVINYDMPEDIENYGEYRSTYLIKVCTDNVLHP